jgi:hypothetical protein
MGIGKSSLVGQLRVREREKRVERETSARAEREREKRERRKSSLCSNSFSLFFFLARHREQ